MPQKPKETNPQDLPTWWHHGSSRIASGGSDCRGTFWNVETVYSNPRKVSPLETKIPFPTKTYFTYMNQKVSKDMPPNIHNTQSSFRLGTTRREKQSAGKDDFLSTAYSPAIKSLFARNTPLHHKQKQHSSFRTSAGPPFLWRMCVRELCLTGTASLFLHSLLRHSRKDCKTEAAEGWSRGKHASRKRKEPFRSTNFLQNLTHAVHVWNNVPIPMTFKLRGESRSSPRFGPQGKGNTPRVDSPAKNRSPVPPSEYSLPPPRKMLKDVERQGKSIYCTITLRKVTFFVDLIFHNACGPQKLKQ